MRFPPGRFRCSPVGSGRGRYQFVTSVGFKLGVKVERFGFVAGDQVGVSSQREVRAVVAEQPL
jgi:hypothetical protein